jgi:hypothetical protein
MSALPKEKSTLILIEHFPETDITKMLQSLTRYLLWLVHVFVKDTPIGT